MLKRQNIEIEAEGAHAAASATDGAAALDALFRTSKLMWSPRRSRSRSASTNLIWPPGDSTVEKTGNAGRRLGGPSAARWTSPPAAAVPVFSTVLSPGGQIRS